MSGVRAAILRASSDWFAIERSSIFAHAAVQWHVAWRPVLVGELEARARDRIAAAAEELHAADWNDPSLDRGAAGAAVLFGYLVRDGYEDAGARAAELLESSVAELSSD